MGGPISRQTVALLLRTAILCGVFFVCAPDAAMAQIYVIEDADGTRRFTNEPVPGARLFLQTRFSPRAETPSGPVPFRNEIAQASRDAGLDARLVEAVIAAESAFDPRARSHKGAQGLMQLMPATADRFGVRNVWDPMDNIVGGTTYLRELMDLYSGDLRHVLAAYNAGEGAVERHGGVPPYPETVEYIDRVMNYYRRVGGR